MVERLLRRNTPGGGKLRAVLRGDARVLLGKLPLPITNRPAGGRRVDCPRPEHKLTVELNSHTWHDVFDQPAQMMRELTALLASRLE